MLFNSYGNKNLIILCAGDNPAHVFWDDHSKPNYDLFVIYYGNNPTIFKRKFNNFTEFFNKKGYKFNLIKEIYNENQKLFKKYKNIFMPDDDLVFKNKDINLFFETFNKHNLFLAQPSVIGYYSHTITLHRFELILRYTNFVEIMMPCFSHESFLKCVNSFDLTPSGWGLDYLWPKILGYPKDKIAIVDQVFGIHPRVVGNSDLYEKNKNVHQEFDKFMAKNNLSKFNQETFNIVKNNNFNKQINEENYYPYSETFKNLFEKIKDKKSILF